MGRMAYARRSASPARVRDIVCRIGRAMPPTRASPRRAYAIRPYKSSLRLHHRRQQARRVRLAMVHGVVRHDRNLVVARGRVRVGGCVLAGVVGRGDRHARRGRPSRRSRSPSTPGGTHTLCPARLARARHAALAARPVDTRGELVGAAVRQHVAECDVPVGVGAVALGVQRTNGWPVISTSSVSGALV